MGLLGFRMRPVSEHIPLILRTRPIGQVRQTIVIGDAIEVSDLVAFGAWTDEGCEYHPVHLAF